MICMLALCDVSLDRNKKRILKKKKPPSKEGKGVRPIKKTPFPPLSLLYVQAQGCNKYVLNTYVGCSYVKSYTLPKKN